MNGRNALIVSIGVLVGFVAGLVASKMTAGSNSNEKVRTSVMDHILWSILYALMIYNKSYNSYDLDVWRHSFHTFFQGWWRRYSLRSFTVTNNETKFNFSSTWIRMESRKTGFNKLHNTASGYGQSTSTSKGLNLYFWPWNRILPIWYRYYLTGDIVTIWI